MTTHSSRLSVVFQTVMHIAAGLVLFSQASVLHALPVAGSTTAGTGKISQSADVLTVKQSSARLAIDWRSFNINSGESVIFKQPSSQSIALNRVLGQDPSTILGNLSANGQVFVLNPNGVLFGHGAQVDVGGLLASSLQLSVADFLAGRYTLSGADHSGSVINQGTLHAQPGGYIALVAPQVVNEGVITAHLGTAALGAGQQVTLTMDAGRLLSFNVDRSAAEALVSNKQLVEADGGTVIMTARAKDALLSTVINNQGVVEARSVSVKDGTIKLDGGTSGVVASNGTLDASGTSVGERGGDIEITGGKVGLFDGAMVNASGNAGGGTVLIGGDTQGRNPKIHNAQATYVAPTTMIKADALDNGDGGKVVVWSDEMTRFAGTISARGGTNGGNGGNVETSGKVYLEAVGSVDASAPAGRAGEWLLDPYDVTLSNSVSSNGGFAGGVFTPTGNSAVASITTIQTSLNGGTSVTVNTTGAGVQAGNITVANSIAKTAGGTATLTLNATNQINFAGGANLTSTTGALNVTLNAGAGGISNLQNVNTNGGALKFNSSGSATQGAGSVISGSGTLVQMGAGTLTLSGTNNYTGATTVSAGTLVATNATALGTTAGGVSVANGATLSINNVAIGAETLTLNGTGMGGNGALTGTGTASLAGNVVLASTSSIGTPSAGDTLTLSGVTSGASGVTKLGAGTLILSGNNTYTGTTTVSSGTLQLGAANRIANGSAVTVAAGATFNLNSFAETVGSIAGPGNINLGTATLTAGGDNTSTSFSGLLSGTGGFTKAGTGTTTLSGVNTYTGATAVSGGTLRLAGGSAIADVSAVTLANTAGVSLDLNGTDETIGSLAGGGATGGNVTLGTGTLTAGGNNTTTTYSGVISGTGGLTKTGTGTLTLAGANLYSGLTSVGAGTLSTTNASGLGTGAGGTTVNSGSTLSISTDILAEALTLNGGILTKDNAATTRTWSGGVTLAAPSTISSAGGTLTLSGTVDGTGNLTKTGAGTLTLSGSNSYTGQTNINAGTTQVAGGNGIGDASAVSVAAGATLNLGGTNETVGSLAGAGNVVLGVGTLTAGGNDGSTTYSGVVSGTGGLTKIGAGTLLVSGNNTYTGGTTISTGTLQLGAANRIADTSAVAIGAGATFNLNGFAETVGSIAGAGNVNLGAATLTAGGNNTSTSFAGVIAGTGGFFKAGSGTLALSGGNTYTGSTAVNGGTLRLAGGNAIADSSSVSLANVAGVTLDLNNSSETIGSLVGGGTTGGNVTLGTGTLTAGGNNTSTTYSGVISGTGGVTKVGTGIMTLSGANLYTGTTAISAGTLQLGAANRIANGSAVTVAAGATFNLNSFAETVGSIAGAGNINLGNATLIAGGDNTSTTFLGALSGTGGFTKAGTGATTLSGVNTYTGATTISGGTLRLTGGGAIADASAVTLANTAGVFLDLNGVDETIGSLAGGGATGGNVTLGAGTLTAGGNNTSTTYSGVISGAGGLVKAGAGKLTLAGANTYSGNTIISAGTLQVAGGNGIGDASSVTVATAATLSLNGTNETVGSLAGAGTVSLGAGTLTGGGNNTSTLYSGVISGTGGLVKSGTGVLTLSGSNTHTGATTISGGTLVASNSAALGSTATGTTVANGATLELDGLALNAETITLNGNGAGGAGALTATGNASITGPVLLATSARIGASAGVSLSLNSTVDGPGSLDIVGGGTVAFRNAVGNTGPLGSLTSDATTTLVINGGLIVTSGAQTYNGLTALGGSTTLRTVGGGNILANGPVIESVGTLFLDTGAGSATFTNASNDFASVAVTSGNAVSLVDANALAVGTSSVGALRAQTLSNDLTLTGAITASGSGDAIVLAAAGNFINTGGSLHANAGRWLVYSTDPASNTLGGVISDFKRYNCTFTAGCLTPGTTLPVTGNGFLYGLAPTLNVTADGVTTTYGASASALTYSASGFIDGDTSANALIGALARSTGAMSGSGNEAAGTYLSNQGSLASMLGYHLTFTGADYTIEPRALAVSTTAQNKIYDGTTGATVTLTDDRITGDALNAGYTSAAFLDRNAGTGNSVMVTGNGLSGADAGDYRLTSSSGTATADITAKPIVVSATSQTKVYGAPDPTLSYAVNTGGLVGSDTLSGALNRQPGETVAAGPYAITQGSLANSDYSITFNNGALVITPATLNYVADSVSIYQWTKLPPFTGTVTGFVAGDTLASATTGTLTFAPGTVGSNTAGTFASNGSGLSANSGDYVFRQAPGNATAFVISPSGETRAPGAPREAYAGGLASASRTVGSCARSAQAEGAPSGCDREGGFAGSLRAWRRAIGLRQLPVAILGSGLNLPVDATAPLSY